jgi:hypothetical protein
MSDKYSTSILIRGIHVDPHNRPSVTAWSTREKKALFAALAASRGLSESKLLGLIIDSVLARNPIDMGTALCKGPGEGDRITVRLRSGDGTLLRARAQKRGMNFSTYTAALIRAHLRVDPPMPFAELARLERGLAQLRTVGRDLGDLLRSTEANDGDPRLHRELAALVQAAERLRQELREVVKANRISWESADVEAAP